MRSNSHSSMPSAPSMNEEPAANAYPQQNFQPQPQPSAQGQQLNFADHPAFAQEYVYQGQQQFQPQVQPQVQSQVQSSFVPNDSYLGSDLQYPDTSLYESAGICIWRQNPNGKGIQFLMPLVTESGQALTFFKKTRVNSDKNAIQTALSAFRQKTGSILSDDILSQIGQSWRTDKDRRLFWKKEWQSVLFFYNMSYDYGIADAENAEEQKNNNSNNNNNNYNRNVCHWVNYDKVYRCVCVTGNPVHIKKQKYPMLGYVVLMFLQREVRQYLEVLHIKNGGLRIKPRNGGRIRGALTHFKHIPKVVRCDFLHPVTHSILFHRWLETNILEMEDYQIFMSLISSLFPEVGGCNFRCFYTFGGLYKDINSRRHNINSVPSFTLVQKEIANRSSAHFSTVISILPTFVVQGNFEEVKFQDFKKRNISWVDELCQDANQKNGNGNSNSNSNNNNGLLSSLSSAMSGWNPFGANSGPWKWQFQNHRSEFEDYDLLTSQIIETAFLNESTFTQFKKGPVPYNINFSKMMQKNCNTQSLRAIRRVNINVSSSPNYTQSRVLDYQKWQYQENDLTWKDFETSVSKQLNGFHATMSRRSSISWQQFSHNNSLRVTVGQYSYQIDVQYMQQKNLSTNKVRSVRKIPVYKNMQVLATSYRWQFEDDGYNNWTDYTPEMSQKIENTYLSTPRANFIVNISTKAKNTNVMSVNRYQITLNNLKQTNLSSKKKRNIRRIVCNNNYNDYYSNNNNSNSNSNSNSNAEGGRHKWEWFTDRRTWQAYDVATSKAIDEAFRSGYKKYFFQSTKNSNSYEIHFTAMQQFNIQSGKQRAVRKISLKPVWNGPGNDPSTYNGPVSKSKSIHAAQQRRTFGARVMTLYCVVGGLQADQIRRSAKFITGNLGPFGCGLYFVESASAAKNMARSRTNDNRGYLVTCRVFVGKEQDLSQSMDKMFDFQGLQQLGFDSIKRRTVNSVFEHIVYNYDQVCIVNVEQYRG